MLARITILALLVVCLVSTSSGSEEAQWLSKQIKQSSNSLNNTNTTNSSIIYTTESSTVSPEFNSTPSIYNIHITKTPTSPPDFHHTANFLNKILDKFDKHTLIMILAFLIGFILVSCLIAISICVCNGLSTCASDAKKSSLPSQDLATNPAYGSVKYDPNFDTGNSHNLSRIDIMIHPGSDIPLLPSKQHDQINLNSTSSMSCSTVSINSVIYNKTPGSIELNIASQQAGRKKPDNVPSQPSTPIKGNIRSSISNLVNTFSSTPNKPSKKNDDKSSSENERSCLLDETDSADLHPNDNTSISNRKPIFQSQSKTGQQILREQKITKHPSYLRTHSEISTVQVENNRLSAASSRSSIVISNIPLNFDQIRDDIDDLAINKDKLVSRTSLNKLNSNDGCQAGHQSDSTSTSIADIYVQDMINKLQQSTQKSNNGVKKLIKQDTAGSVSSVMSESTRERLKLKRLSMNIDVSKVDFEMNPGGAQSTTNLDKNASVSNYTIGSEKSCY